jgi:23S rRNA pseudouridine955/2504/2580 synthase
MPKYEIITSNSSNIKILKFIKDNFPYLDNITLQKAFRNKDILLNGKKVKDNVVLNKNDSVFLSEFIIKIFNNKKNISFEKNNFEKYNKNTTKQDIEKFKTYIIYENDKMLAINKPNGLAVQGGSRIKKSIADFLQNGEKLVHRLDKDASGVLIIAKDKEEAKILTNYFKNKDENLEKIYLAIVVGKFTKNIGEINLPLLKKIENGIEKVYVDKMGKESITLYKVLDYNTSYNLSLVEIKILTGRTHQIRVHLKELGHPILGDGKYGEKKAYIENFSPKLHLHSYKLDIKEENINLMAQIPDFFQQTIDKNKFNLPKS